MMWLLITFLRLLPFFPCSLRSGHMATLVLLFFKCTEPVPASRLSCLLFSPPGPHFSPFLIIASSEWTFLSTLSTSHPSWLSRASLILLFTRISAPFSPTYLTLECKCNEKRNFICSLLYPGSGTWILNKYLLMDNYLIKIKSRVVCVWKTQTMFCNKTYWWKWSQILKGLWHVLKNSFFSPESCGESLQHLMNFHF